MLHYNMFMFINKFQPFKVWVFVFFFSFQKYLNEMILDEGDSQSEPTRAVCE